jgi:hypothetical protein
MVEGRYRRGWRMRSAGGQSAEEAWRRAVRSAEQGVGARRSSRRCGQCDAGARERRRVPAQWQQRETTQQRAQADARGAVLRRCGTDEEQRQEARRSSGAHRSCGACGDTRRGEAGAASGHQHARRRRAQRRSAGLCGTRSGSGSPRRRPAPQRRSASRAPARDAGAAQPHAMRSAAAARSSVASHASLERAGRLLRISHRQRARGPTSRSAPSKDADLACLAPERRALSRSVPVHLRRVAQGTARGSAASAARAAGAAASGGIAAATAAERRQAAERKRCAMQHPSPDGSVLALLPARTRPHEDRATFIGGTCCSAIGTGWPARRRLLGQSGSLRQVGSAQRSHALTLEPARHMRCSFSSASKPPSAKPPLPRCCDSGRQTRAFKGRKRIAYLRSHDSCQDEACPKGHHLRRGTQIPSSREPLGASLPRVTPRAPTWPPLSASLSPCLALERPGYSSNSREA